MVPTSNGHRRRLPTKQHKIIEIPPNPGGTQRPCRDAGVGAIAPGFAMRKKASALHTLIHQRHLTPSCGGHAPTAERTLNPARTCLESLDRRPGIREQPGSKGGIAGPASYFSSTPEKGHPGVGRRCQRRAMNGSQAHYSITSLALTRRFFHIRRRYQSRSRRALMSMMHRSSRENRCKHCG